MLKSISIKNYKSILDITVDLGRINVFIGENGCGKTNILEAIAMTNAYWTFSLTVEGLYNKGVRVAKPNLTFSSFLNKKQNNMINIDMEFDEFSISSQIYSEEEDIRTEWRDKNSRTYVHTEELIRIETDHKERLLGILSLVERYKEKYDKTITEYINLLNNDLTKNLFKTINEDLAENEKNKLESENQIIETTKLIEESEKKIKNLKSIYNDEIETSSKYYKYLTDYLIYNLNTKALRGISNESKKTPLGINGEGLDILISSFKKEELKKLMEYSHFISWLEEIVIDQEDILKFQNHKLGKSVSTLYFKDKFMKKKNNIFSAENANEGVLHILFYLALFISNKTPDFFGIDNIETALNPKMCRSLIKELAKLSKETNKQALITTHNPAVLDGLNLFDDDQRLFVVSRTDEGYTKVERIKLKPDIKGENLKLSEMWMRGYIGGIPNNF